MSDPVRFVRMPGRSAEDAVRRSRTMGNGYGFAVDVDLLAVAGPAIVAALDEQGPVIVMSPLTGSPERVGAAAARLARYGAAWVAVDAAAGSAVIAAAVAGVAGTGCGVAAATLPPHADDVVVAATHGTTRGKVVARLARVAAGAGASAVIGVAGDIGVVASVAGDLAVIAETFDDETAGDALRRGAVALVVPEPAGSDR